MKPANSRTRRSRTTALSPALTATRSWLPRPELASKGKAGPIRVVCRPACRQAHRERTSDECDGRGGSRSPSRTAGRTAVGRQACTGTLSTPTCPEPAPPRRSGHSSWFSRSSARQSPAQLAAAELVPRLEELSARQAPARQARHDHLRAELARHLPGWDAPPVPGGQTLWVRLPYGDGTSFAQTALRHRVAILPGSGLDASGQSQDYLRLHFATRADDLTEAVKRLADAWHAYRPPPSHPPLCPSDGAAMDRYDTASAVMQAQVRQTEQSRLHGLRLRAKRFLLSTIGPCVPIDDRLISYQR